MTTLREVVRGGADAVKALGAPLSEDGVEIAMLWSAGHYDGPRTGVCLFRGAKHWFEAITNGLGERVAFLVVAVTQEDLRAEERRHDLFVRLVGLHTDYRYENGQRLRVGGPVRQADSQWKDYCEQTRDMRVDFGGHEVVGWWGSTLEEIEADLAEGPEVDTEEDEKR